MVKSFAILKKNIIFALVIGQKSSSPTLWLNISCNWNSHRVVKTGWLIFYIPSDYLNVSSMKKKADLSDLSEINRANISAPAIWKIGKIRFLIIFTVELSINPFRNDFLLMLNKLKLRKSSNSRSLSFIFQKNYL